MTARSPRPHVHLLAIALLGGVVLFINASSSDNPLRAQDRDLFTLMRADHPDLLRELDLRPPKWFDRWNTKWQRLPLASLSALDLSGLDLRGLRLSYRPLQHVNLHGSHLEQAEFNCVPMKNVIFEGANLREAQFNYRFCKSAMELKVNLNGADLSRADLHGGRSHKGSCEKPLTIKGNLNGAKFEGATLRCVRLISTSTMTASSPSSPEYAGISFVQSDVEDLELKEGNFVFSNFSYAKLHSLSLDPQVADLRFTTLAHLNCKKDSSGCALLLKPGSGQDDGLVRQRLSLDVRGSQIRSNLQLPNEITQWPALLCDRSSRWYALQKKNAPSNNSANGASFWIMKKKQPTCFALNP